MIEKRDYCDNNFKDALYLSKGTGMRFWVAGFLFAFFAILGLVFIRTQKNAPEGVVQTVTIICSVIIGLGFGVIILSSVLGSIMRKRVFFAVFPGHLLINIRAAKKPEYVKIFYRDILQYTFDAYCTYDKGDTMRLFPRYENWGKLKVVTSDSKFETQITNIIGAREWMQKLVSVQETLE